MKKWSFFDPATGEISPMKLTSSDPEAVNLNTPAGLQAIEGWHDHLCERVDVSGEVPLVVPWQPPQPSDEHEWNELSRRWRLTAEASRARSERAEAIARIDVLERGQHRALREVALGRPGAAERLAAIDQEIEALRPVLK